MSVKKFAALIVAVLTVALATAATEAAARGNTTNVLAVVSPSRLTYLAMSFFGGRDGAVLESLAPAKKAEKCSLVLYTTTDGATHWSAPLLFGKGIPCADDLPYQPLSLSVTGSGTWWLAIDDKLFTGSLHGRFVHRVILPDGYGACSVAASGSSVYVPVAFPPDRTDMPLSCSGWLWYSADGGRSWTNVKSLPISLAGAFEMPTPESVVLLGWLVKGGPPYLPGGGPVSVAQRTGSGPWRMAVLPCKVLVTGFVASYGKHFAVACLAEAGGGVVGTEILASDDGGHRWSEGCSNGFWGAAKKTGSCPAAEPFTMPTGLAVVRDGTLVMSDENLGLVASSNGGASWKVVNPSMRGSPMVELSSEGGVIWALESWPASGAVVRLAQSTNGTTWHSAKLPRF
jgi:hypothetical protein